MDTAIVVGAGAAGLAAAGRLARSSYRESLLEENDRADGRMDRIARDGYLFDTGPTLLLLLMPEVSAETYRALGQRLSDHSTLGPATPNCRVLFADGSHLDLSGDLHALSRQFAVIEPGSFERRRPFAREGYRHDHRSPERTLREQGLPALRAVPASAGGAG